MEIHPIAHIENNYKELFGIPRQSGITEAVESRVVFEKEYSDKNVIIGYTGDDENIIDENKTYVVPIDEDAIGLFGVDISVYQANIDWKKIADKGEVKYVIIRCGWGENITKYDDRLLDIYADRERIERHLENKREMYLSTMPYAIERVKQLGQI